MRIFLAMAFAASLFVAAGCACATGTCEQPVSDCSPCAATTISTVSAPVVIATAPAPIAVAPAITCNPCAGL